MQHQQQQMHDPMLAYPPHVYYSSSAPAVASSSHLSLYPAFPHASAGRPSAAFIPAQSAFAELRSSNCCDICCPGCSSCIPFLGNCQCCDRNCLPCCQTCWGCMPGGTCSASGSCPTFCSGYVGGWSVSLCLQWLSFLLLLVAVPLRRWYLGTSRSEPAVGLWTVDIYYYLGSDALLKEMIDINMFNALRAFTILSIIFTLLSAMLATVRLYRQQRERRITKRLEWSTHAMAVSSLACVVIAMALGTAIMYRIQLPRPIYSWYHGEGLILLDIAFGMTVIATPLHIITTVLYNRANSKSSGSMSDFEGAVAAPVEHQQLQQVYQQKGQGAQSNDWASSNIHSSAGNGTATDNTVSSSYFSHPSAYQPPTRTGSDTAQYQVYLSSMAAAPVDMKPQW